jgi:hypothetical protein
MNDTFQNSIPAREDTFTVKPQVLLVETGGRETHIALIGSVEAQNQLFALEHSNQLITEYDCTTPSERMLCELAAGAMARYISASHKLNYLRDEYWSTTNRRTRSGSRHQQQEEEWTTVHDHLHRITIESKEVDRSLRQYQGIISQLTHKKSPVPEVHIKAAFLAQNQQINLQERHEAN